MDMNLDFLQILIPSKIKIIHRGGRPGAQNRLSFLVNLRGPGRWTDFPVDREGVHHDQVIIDGEIPGWPASSSHS